MRGEIPFPLIPLFKSWRNICSMITDAAGQFRIHTEFSRDYKIGTWEELQLRKPRSRSSWMYLTRSKKRLDYPLPNINIQSLGQSAFEAYEVADSSLAGFRVSRTRLSLADNRDFRRAPVLVCSTPRFTALSMVL